MPDSDRLYLKKMITVATLYLVVTFVSQWSIDAYDLGALEIAIALTPVVPLFWATFEIRAYTRSLDELQRRIQLDAVVFSATVTGLFFASYGLLETVGFPPIDNIWVMPMLAVLWVVGGIRGQRAYQ